jgi:hypothetical protein
MDEYLARVQYSKEGLPQSHRTTEFENGIIRPQIVSISLMEQTAIEVYQETSLDAAQAQICEKLRFK